VNVRESEWTQETKPSMLPRMLQSLRIKNLAIAEDIQVRFEAGLNNCQAFRLWGMTTIGL